MSKLKLNLVPAQFEELLSQLDPVERAVISWRAEMIAEQRPKQLAPAGNWFFWLILAGRGWGKTLVGARYVLQNVLTMPGCIAHVVAPTQADVRGTCFEGVSGLLAKMPTALRPTVKYSSTDLEIRFPHNGSAIRGFSAEKPDRLRGPQCHVAWGDELASWGGGDSGRADSSRGGRSRLLETWDNLLYGLRLGTDPRLVLTTTPRPLKFLRMLEAHEKTIVTRGSTLENRANLAETTLKLLYDTYDGTRKGRQELHAEILTDVEGALWTLAQIERCRTYSHPEMIRIVVAVDPATTAQALSDETGIIVEGLGEDGKIYTLDDVSGKYSPREWAQRTLQAYERWGADCIVAEVNQGGDMVGNTLRAEAEGRAFRLKTIHARRGKYLRAEPVAALYEKDRCRHFGKFTHLERQMTEWTGSATEESPDRLDAKVYASLELITGSTKNAFL